MEYVRVYFLSRHRWIREWTGQCHKTTLQFKTIHYRQKVEQSPISGWTPLYLLMKGFMLTRFCHRKRYTGSRNLSKKITMAINSNKLPLAKPTQTSTSPTNRSTQSCQKSTNLTTTSKPCNSMKWKSHFTIIRKSRLVLKASPNRRPTRKTSRQKPHYLNLRLIRWKMTASK